ncbi:MAG TPA: hypothetical protein VGR73_20150 [Bryobacteraceae bacterium]|nr:hypothetical protein [Bryobacteraceae bacterium]
MLISVMEASVSEDQEISAAELSCPKCGSHDVRRSKAEGFWAAIQRTFGRWPFRCRSCRARFFRLAEPPENDI